MLKFMVATGDKTNAAKITNHHFKMCIAGKSLQYSYCDYWLYGGVQDPSEEKQKVSRTNVVQLDIDSRDIQISPV